MDKTTKQDALLEYMKDLKNVCDKIISNNAQKSDYILLREYFIMVGVSDDHIDGLYNNCGFSDSEDFFNQRQKPQHHQTGNVSCTLSKIEGTTEGVLEAVQYEIARLNQVC